MEVESEKATAQAGDENPEAETNLSSSSIEPIEEKGNEDIGEVASAEPAYSETAVDKYEEESAKSKAEGLPVTENNIVEGDNEKELSEQQEDARESVEEGKAGQVTEEYSWTETQTVLETKGVEEQGDSLAQAKTDAPSVEEHEAEHKADRSEEAFSGEQPVEMQQEHDRGHPDISAAAGQAPFRQHPSSDEFNADGCTFSIRIFKNLSHQANEPYLRKLLEPYGKVMKVELLWDSGRNRPRDFGFMTMATPEQAQAVLQRVNGVTIIDRKVNIEVAKRSTAPKSNTARNSKDSKGGRKRGGLAKSSAQPKNLGRNAPLLGDQIRIAKRDMKGGRGRRGGSRERGRPHGPSHPRSQEAMYPGDMRDPRDLGMGLPPRRSLYGDDFRNERGMDARRDFDRIDLQRERELFQRGIHGRDSRDFPGSRERAYSPPPRDYPDLPPYGREPSWSLGGRSMGSRDVGILPGDEDLPRERDRMPLREGRDFPSSTGLRRDDRDLLRDYGRESYLPRDPLAYDEDPYRRGMRDDRLTAADILALDAALGRSGDRPFRAGSRDRDAEREFSRPTGRGRAIEPDRERLLDRYGDLGGYGKGLPQEEGSFGRERSYFDIPPTRGVRSDDLYAPARERDSSFAFPPSSGPRDDPYSGGYDIPPLRGPDRRGPSSIDATLTKIAAAVGSGSSMDRALRRDDNPDPYGTLTGRPEGMRASVSARFDDQYSPAPSATSAYGAGPAVPGGGLRSRRGGGNDPHGGYGGRPPMY